MEPHKPNSEPEKYSSRQEYSKILAVLTGIFGLSNFTTAETIATGVVREAGKTSTSLLEKAEQYALLHLQREQQLRQIKDGFPRKKAGSSIRKAFAPDEVQNSWLRMIFTSCHPEIPADARLALPLELLWGFNSREIAHILMIGEQHIVNRLTQVRQYFGTETLPFAIPSDQNIQKRLQSVFVILYQLFLKGYQASHLPKDLRSSLCFETLSLTRQLAEYFPGKQVPQDLLDLKLSNLPSH